MAQPCLDELLGTLAHELRNPLVAIVSAAQVIANVYTSGLGLPDRDYYLKPEPRFQDAREKYLVHVNAMFKLAGYDDANAMEAEKYGQTNVKSETWVASDEAFGGFKH